MGGDLVEAADVGPEEPARRLTGPVGVAIFLTAPAGQKVQTVVKDTSALAGALAGGEIGAERGAAIGTFIEPGGGTVVGGVVGGIVGAVAGSGIGDAINSIGGTISSWF
ncbi:hypothetical protein [Amycolatopsis sp. NPDC051903]|uniref:hypothetical protein n=1 Tax=Amycolatopsis sp. NPDC051903 TaxID=3363936 RepID=UPI00378761EA